MVVGTFPLPGMHAWGFTPALPDLNPLPNLMGFFHFVKAHGSDYTTSLIIRPGVFSLSRFILDQTTATPQSGGDSIMPHMICLCLALEAITLFAFYLTTFRAEVLRMFKGLMCLDM
jgi:hypothetical protein